ncbi:CubicO group peptidase, beta-lactamase class C family [Arenibacter nanhaiticus]|uniref:CubicO group peptidase, beta-lactamase class C family n=1 Tax=Arenibacter nanhaiticus TaxID=558155 RepID=A0A1M6HJT7_9FLAO|nr:serine hydrolase domain-containing protein [Arenibacter nanhaiticus]SHJ22445.1 CubicO group peptidase, beta-lactamase class C family [Arenibacter nanhaiticus]
MSSKEIQLAEEMLLQLIEEQRIPGLAITVRKKNAVCYEKGFGCANLEDGIPIDPQKTIFRIASVSKPIAASALAVMVNEGQIRLDTSFYQYVPYFPPKEYDFTIGQLASHTAGIRSYRGMEYGLDKPFSIKDGISVFKDDPLLFRPGSNYHYSSYDWVLISLAMEEVSGLQFKDYVKEKVLDPLGLKNTFAEISGETMPFAATFYSKRKSGFRKAIPVNNFYKLAGGGYLSTTADIALLGDSYLNGKMSDNAVVPQFLKSQLIEGIPTYYGLGWEVSADKKGRPYFGHIGNGVGGYAVFYVFPAQEMVFSIMTNCTNPGVLEELNAVIDIFLE